ncbi:hypothetical protein JCM8547_000459 [Rhodosporidiobolus lusitaniae]
MSRSIMAIVLDPSPPPADEGKVAIAEYDYDAVEPNELTFEKGDRFIRVEPIDPDWWLGETDDGRKGLFPSNYVELIDPDPRPPSSGTTSSPRVLFISNWLSQRTPTRRRKQTSSFRAGEKVTVRAHLCPDWWYGQVEDGSRGLFPANYLQLQ